MWKFRANSPRFVLQAGGSGFLEVELDIVARGGVLDACAGRWAVAGEILAEMYKEGTVSATCHGMSACRACYMHFFPVSLSAVLYCRVCNTRRYSAVLIWCSAGSLRLLSRQRMFACAHVII